MYVCCCNAVTDREVAEAIEGGAHTRADVTRDCGAGGECGACHEMIEGMIETRAFRCARGGQSGQSEKSELGKRPEKQLEPSLIPAVALVRERAA